jgi:hypothetical protein
MFLWSFWYIIYIFLIWNELVMNFSSFNYFQEFQLNRKTLSVPDLDLPTEIDQWVLAMSAATLAVDWSTQLTGPWTLPPASWERRRRRYRAFPATRLRLFEPEQYSEPKDDDSATAWSPELPRGERTAAADGGYML